MHGSKLFQATNLCPIRSLLQDRVGGDVLSTSTTVPVYVELCYKGKDIVDAELTVLVTYLPRILLVIHLKI